MVIRLLNIESIRLFIKTYLCTLNIILAFSYSLIHPYGCKSLRNNPITSGFSSLSWLESGLIVKEKLNTVIVTIVANAILLMVCVIVIMVSVGG
jgi:hypothetical protein